MSYPTKHTQSHSSRVLVLLLALIACGVVALQRESSPLEPLGMDLTMAPQESTPQAVTSTGPPVPALDGAAERVNIPAPEPVPTGAPEPNTRPESRERLLYSFTFREESARGTLENSGTLVLVLDHGDEEQRSLEASVRGLTLHDSEADLSALTTEVSGASVTFGLDRNGALKDLAVAEGASPAAIQLWKQILGRWQVSSNDSDAQGWMAWEATEIGKARCRYRRDGTTLERRLVGYTNYTDPEQMPGSMSTGKATITADDLPITITGTEELRRTRMIRSKISIDYHYTRVSRTALETGAS